QDPCTCGEQTDAMTSDRFVHRDILFEDGEGLAMQSLGEAVDTEVRPLRCHHLLHTLQRPEQVHCGGACLCEHGTYAVEALGQITERRRTQVTHAERHAHRRCDTDGRRTANHHLANPVTHFLGGTT